MRLTNKVYFPHQNQYAKGMTGVGFVGTADFGVSDVNMDTYLEAPLRFGDANKITVREIGGFTYTNYNCFIRADKIGRYCSIAPNVSVGMGEHFFESISTSTVFDLNPGERLYRFSGLGNDKEFVQTIHEGHQRLKLGKRRKMAGGVHIGNDVWIGTGAIILAGISIGDGAVIAAGSVVTKDVEPYAIVGGTPAKLLKKRFDEEIVDKLEKLKWWEYEPKIFEGINYTTDIRETIKRLDDRIQRGYPLYKGDRYLVSSKSRKIYYLGQDDAERKVIYSI